MKIIAFMQNQWLRRFNDPAVIEQMFLRYPEKRNYLIKHFIFSDCLIGMRLREAFGDLCDSIIWEEASPFVADSSSDEFVVDIDHIKKAIAKHAPDVIVCFGKAVWLAVREVSDIRVFYAPHPAARLPDIMERMKYNAQEINRYISERNNFKAD